VNYTLQYEGQTLAVWRCVGRCVPYFGRIVAVQYRGRLTLFRAVSQDENVIAIDLV
jgi:hypothetical protein